MSDLVANVQTRDTGRDITALLNTIAAENGISAVELLAGAVIAEGAWNEHATRERAWPDVSYGFGQPAAKWFDYRAAFAPAFIARHTTLESDGTMADTPENRADVQAYMWDAERALRYVAPRYARLRGTWGNAVEAWCRWNKPNVSGAANPNRANYVRALAEAEQYRVKEEPMPDPITDPTEAIRQLQAQQSLQSEAIAAILANHYQDGPQSAKGLLVQLDPNKYGSLAVVEMQPKT